MAQVYWPFSTSTVTEWPASAGRPNHWGTDFGVPQGTPLRATVDGTIVRHNSDGFGAYVLDIIADDGLLVRNGHLSRMDVNTGQRVKAGDVIGLTGGIPGTPGAGYSTGAHLHWELRRDRLWSGGAWVDPRRMQPPVKNFGEIEPEKKEDEHMAVGAFWRISKGQGQGNIYWQETPLSPLFPLTWNEWLAFAANGNKLADFDASVIEEAIRDFGVIQRDTKGNGVAGGGDRPIRDGSSWTGWKLYQPGW